MIPVCPTTALPPGEATRVAADEPIAVLNVDGDFYAIDLKKRSGAVPDLSGHGP